MLKSFYTIGVLVCVSASASAAELSPWFGSDDQAPFQLDPLTMVAVTFAADPLQTGSTGKPYCDPKGCLPPPEAAITPDVVDGAPQN